MWYLEQENKKKLIEIASSNVTPVYIYHTKTLLKEIDKYKKAFNNENIRLLYAFKANSNPKICKIIRNSGIGADVVSGGELNLALRLGFRDISFSGPGKTYDELKLAVSKKITFINVESFEEFELLAKIVSKSAIRTGLSVRINPEVDISSHSYIKTSVKYSKFGVDFETAKRIYRKALSSKYLDIRAIHFHLGSQVFEAKFYSQALKKVIDFVRSLRVYGIDIRTIDIGGGWGVREGEEAGNHNKLFEVVKPYLNEFSFILEPGRSIVASCGVILTRVLYRKKVDNCYYIVIVDAAINNLIRPALYGSYHPIFSLNRRREKSVLCDIAGSSCESSDFFARGIKIPLPKKGDILIISSCGAYSYSMSSNYNLRGFAKEILI